MINTKMREYKYYKYDGEDEYGQAKLSEKPMGKVKIAIYKVSEQLDGSIKFSKGLFQGITMDKNIDDTYILKYGKDKLKVTSIMPSDSYYRLAYLTRV
jgi:hypothetical protein